MFFVISTFLLPLSAEEMKSSARYLPFSCGKLSLLSFPFANSTNPECGLCTVDNCTEKFKKIQLQKGGKWFQIVTFTQSNIIRIHEENFRNFSFQNCSLFYNIIPPSSPSISFHFVQNRTILKCKETLMILSPNLSHTRCNDFNVYYNLSRESFPSLPPECLAIQLPVENYGYKVASTFNIEARVSPDCKTDSEGMFHCSNGEKGTSRNGNQNQNRMKKAVLASIGAGIGIVMIMVMVILAICFPRKFPFVKSLAFWRKKTDTHHKFETFLRTQECFAPKRYSYKEVKKITSSFKDKLGQGGCGSVYKGKLEDGSLVAVKFLNNLKGNGEEFINEVASISRTSHVNIVKFLGFCFDGTKRALIYEFMPNGSLEKFIYEKNPSKESVQLGGEKLYMISLGIAQGLEYLHRGCNAKILHFDIKPHNILLDENFCPKISDFGLAKVCPRQESTISLLGARGTPGYIAPEVFSRKIGGISHKSDVYSYGMMVLEMVGGRHNIDVSTDHSSDLYFPDWIYKCLEVDEEFGLLQTMNENGKETVRKMIIVSLWCIQTVPSKRPPMSEVVDMLKGSLHSLQIPHRPFVLSAPQTPADADTDTDTDTDAESSSAHAMLA